MLHPQRLLPVDAGALCRPDLLLYPLLVQAADPRIRMIAMLKKRRLTQAIAVIFINIFICQKFDSIFQHSPCNQYLFFFSLIIN
jgi:hypothetical protein